jgi:hypothetical protein
LAGQRPKSDELVLSSGDSALNNIQQMQDARRMNRNYTAAEPNVKEKTTQPGFVCFRNDKEPSVPSCRLDWTAGQRAHTLMESLRLGIYELQTGKNVGLEPMAIQDATAIWPDLRNIYCREYLAGMYFDLQGQKQFCEVKKRWDTSTAVSVVFSQVSQPSAIRISAQSDLFRNPPASEPVQFSSFFVFNNLPRINKRRLVFSEIHLQSKFVAVRCDSLYGRFHNLACMQMHQHTITDAKFTFGVFWFFLGYAENVCPTGRMCNKIWYVTK